MRRILIALTAAAGLALAACSDDEPADTPDVEATAAMPEAPEELVDAITDVADGVDPDEILDNAENVCLDIEQGKQAETLARNAAMRFGIDEADAPALVDAIEPHCEAIR